MEPDSSPITTPDTPRGWPRGRGLVPDRSQSRIVLSADPEASVSALVFHHPDCAYYSVEATEAVPALV